ncbi:hypothetical protein [Pseudomonas fluorescens]|uniref:SSU ribosomal protein S2p (SAe) n=1 Tax=Pseudomonas fluorescens TaxID=294 RepID=A0A5E7US22_PSEFL|nr:hypothetical protein [Pseudomonas fluorescens]VVN92445.1 hypothetical protein PS833_01980 [Pseudomonas fluorescens]VVQ14307.1 hypothetical protein PS914_05585 [Pseudomonas fluorescens]
MAEPLAFINSRTQTYESLKAQLGLTGVSKSKFDALNSHIANTVVLAGELVIIGDVSTSSSTSQEAYLMAKARDIHIGLLTNQVDADDFFLDNFELLKEVLTYSSIGAGVVSDGWSKHMSAIGKTLEEIEQLHKEFLRTGSETARKRFLAERAILFSRLEVQLAKAASYGSGLRHQGSIKRLLGISTKSYLHTGEIVGYAEKVDGVAKAAKLIKSGTYIGAALTVASSGLAIRNACALGREDQCTRAKYVEGFSLAGSLGGSAVFGSLGGFSATYGCILALGIATGGPGALVCGVVGGAVAGYVGGKIVGDEGGNFGEYLYGKMAQ